MSVKEKIITRLSGGDMVSGESLAAELGVSRAAVWKAVKGLIAEGYEIESAKGAGYRMISSNVLTESGIRAALGSSALSKGLDLYVFDVTDSTNSQARAYAEANGSRRPAVFIANEQTSGRGRRGRSFASERGVGLYISFLTYPEGTAKDGVSITAYTAVAVCRALERLTKIKPTIKWVNDIYSGGKKLSGILTEGSIDMESGSLSYAVTGIGINVYKRDFGELCDIATDIEAESGERIDRCALAAQIIEAFLGSLHKVGSSAIAEEYRKRSFLIGERVMVVKLSEEYPATVTGITDGCELLLVRDDGSKETLSTGEVSLKLTV